ncbi:hypothetical protein [Motilimonas sp. KMU-193]|uniref:hypothetical protein n=1 Tax=Motilimonas sp. KMU-193 TaxID=3388668 RepID=UPI00396B1297
MIVEKLKVQDYIVFHDGISGWFFYTLSLIFSSKGSGLSMERFINNESVFTKDIRGVGVSPYILTYRENGHYIYF